jgi:hypothetical protein
MVVAQVRGGIFLLEKALILRKSKKTNKVNKEETKRGRYTRELGGKQRKLIIRRFLYKGLITKICVSQSYYYNNKETL